MESAVSPVFLVSRVFGAAAPVRASYVHYCHILGVVGLLLASSGFSVLSLSNPKSVLRLTLDRFQLSIDTTAAVFSVLLAGFANGVRHRSLLADLADADSALGKSRDSTRRYYLLATLSRLSAVSLAVLLLYLTGNPEDPLLTRFSHALSTVLTYTIAHLVENQHNTLLHTVQVRFRILIEKLVLIKGARDQMDRQRELVSMVKIYNTLVESCHNINQMYGKQILLIVGNIFILTTKNANNVVESIIVLVLNLQREQNLLVLFSFAYVACLRLLELWSVIRSCEEVKIQAKNFSSSLYQYMIEENVDSCRNKKLRLHLTVQREPHFTAYGFFPLDFTLLHSIIAAATTYLVILIQFSQNSMASSQKKVPNSTSPIFYLDYYYDDENDTYV